MQRKEKYQINTYLCPSIYKHLQTFFSKFKFKVNMKFLRNLLASILGTLIALSIILLLFIAIGMALGETDKVVVKNNSVLEIKLNAEVKDYAPKGTDFLDEFLAFRDEKMGLN